MNVTVEIDPDSGFCGGVIRAVDRAEEYLSGAEHSRLYSLGSIVHNGTFAPSCSRACDDRPV